MSTQVQLHIRTDEMTREFLMSHGAIGGILGKLAHAGRDIREDNEILSDAPNQIVGNDGNDFPRQVRQTINELREIDDALIASVEAIADSMEDEDGYTNPDETVEFLKENKGKEVFTISW